MIIANICLQKILTTNVCNFITFVCKIRFKVYICGMTGKKLKSIIDSRGIKHQFVADEIEVDKSDLSLALNDKRNNARMKEIRLLVAKFLNKKK